VDRKVKINNLKVKNVLKFQILNRRFLTTPEGYLVFNILKRAIRDLKSKNKNIKKEARIFLESEDCEFYIKLIYLSSNDF
jgi:hypothetical protein